MIFVTLGTQDKSFDRLLKIIDNQIKKGIIKDKVIVQAGYTKYVSKHMKIFDYVSKDDFEKYITECDVLITHAGVGSIFSGLERNKKIMAIPRLSKYKEQHNDHQLEICQSFSEKGYILSFNNEKEFIAEYSKINKFKPNKYKSNNSEFCNKLINYIENN